MTTSAVRPNRTEKCGCLVWRKMGERRLHIRFCSLHAAAPELLKAITEMLDAKMIATNDLWTNGLGPKLLKAVANASEGSK